MTARMTDAEKKVREYLARIGRRGGLNSRRELLRQHAKQMVAIREAKRAARCARSQAAQAFLKAFTNHSS